MAFTRLNRPPKDLSSFLGRKWLEAIALENEDLSSIVNLPFVLVSASSSLSNSRTLAVDTTLTLTDSGAGSALTLGINLNKANTWLQDQSVPDEAFGAGWNGSAEVPTKNALYDKIAALASGISGAIQFSNGSGGFSSDATKIFWDDANNRLGLGTGSPTSTLQISGGSFSAAYVAKTANYTLSEADYTVECTSNSFTITLPTAVGITGRIYNIKNSGNGVITINTTSSQTIDGNASGTLILSQYDNLTLQSNGANWIIL